MYTVELNNCEMTDGELLHGLFGIFGSKGEAWTFIDGKIKNGMAEVRPIGPRSVLE